MMKDLLKAFILILPLMVAGVAEAQTNYFDFTYEKKAVKERRPLEYRYIREADAVYAQRVYRIIDSREKQNLAMNWPKYPLNRLLYEAVANGDLTAYRNDSLESFYTPEEVMEIGGYEETVQIYPDPDDPYYYYDSVIYSPFDETKIIKYQLLEDWIFDKQSGLFSARIIALAPMYKPEVEGMELPEQPMFWVDWNEARQYLINYELFNRHNDAARLTYYDFFEMRMFSSYIIREPNEFDYYVKDFEQYRNDPFAALLEAERIKNELFNFEHDLWEY